MSSIVVIGAGQAGGWVAKTLRDQEFSGKIVLIGEEKYPPYERPPLSKEVLLGSRTPESTYIWPVSKYTELGIDLMLCNRAVSIDRTKKTVLLSNGTLLDYDYLMLSTGSRVRKLNISGADLPGVFYMRGIGDTVAISQSLRPGSHLLVIGGGWIGLEIAAAARQRDIDVTLVESCGQLCARVLPANIANYLQRRHEHQGVRILLDTTVTRFEGRGRFEAVKLSNGDRISADLAVVGVGVIPNSEIAAEAGLESDNGIIVDSSGRTSDESIYAAGDVANQPDGSGGRVRLESWSNAQNQAIAVAKAMLGADSQYQELPYFWSDQYETKLQVLGSFRDYSEIVHRDHGHDQLLSFYMKGNKIAAVVAVNRTRDIPIVRRLMQKNIALDPQRLACGSSLNEILRAIN